MTKVTPYQAMLWRLYSIPDPAERLLALRRLALSLKGEPEAA